ncbi:class III lanthionine synthetase LanKC [[Pseudopropionibacterium] massiliense]|uniref:class III lanthionine synthetase LanKC n=1 Tax=[Pseudopropionibacterium] massiliense TaxID=2220000 RepID=UPI001030F068|nr:class III lanthionine synthetase LanKC [[Pseudopropionibacterium] massiliense]
MPKRIEYFQGLRKGSPFYGRPRPFVELQAGGLVDRRLQSVGLPAGWLVQSWKGWEGWTPRDWQPRMQGWKVHVSATPGCAVETLARTTRVCVDFGVSFKFLPTLAELTESSSKNQARGAAGKFITIYPDDDDQLGELLGVLAGVLRGQEGPYILSDLRYVPDAPVFVRYGAIMGVQMPDVDDELVESIVDPRSMRLIPDHRDPRVVIPDGVDVPEFLRSAYEASQQSCVSRLDDFVSIKPLSFSNAGGVYRAELPGGEFRILREARPHAGLDGRNRCALQRQLVEEEVLRDLVGVKGVQQLRGVFTAWEHRYLEVDYIPGVTLSSWMVQNTHLQENDPVGYARQAVAVVDQLIAIVEAIHRRGWVFGDLHPGNVLVSDDGTVTMLDLEDASRVDSEREIGVRVFEYCADESADAVQADWFAVARCIMMLYHADFEIEAVSPAFWDRCRRRVREVYGERAAEQLVLVEGRYAAGIRPVTACDVTVDVPSRRLGVDSGISGLLSGIEWSRQFGPDGAFPGDIGQLTACSHEVITTGRAGVVLAQQRVGAQPADSDVDALRKAAREWPGQEAPGLLDGLAGVALTLSEVDAHQDAVAAAGEALERAVGRRRLDLAAGQAGVILAALEVAKTVGDSELMDRAVAAYRRLDACLTPDGSAWTSLCRRRGLFWGLTGVALTDLVAHAVTGAEEPLARARVRVRADLDACVTMATGEVMVDDREKKRVLPYIEWGSAGLLLIASALERITGEPVLTPQERDGIIKACSSEFYIYPGLDHGRAGILVTLTAAGEHYRAEADRQAGLLLDSLLTHGENACVIGDGMIRLSSDLGTGAAGVALALHAYRSRHPYVGLPVGTRTAALLHQPAVSQLGSETRDLVGVVPSH